MQNKKTRRWPGAKRGLSPTILVALAAYTASALPAGAVDLNVTSGTFEVTAPGDVTQDRVVVDNSGDADATLQINAGVTFSKDIILNNDGLLINEGTILRSGSGYDGAFGDVGMARVTNREGGTITVDDIGMWLKADGTVLNTGDGTSINGRIGISINGTADVTNELGAEINAGTGAGLYLNNGTVMNRSGASITSDGAEAVRMSGSGSVTNTGADSEITGDTFGVTILGAGEVYNLDGASISAGAAIRIGGLGTVENEGTITSDNGSSAGVTMTGGGTLTNRATGQISGYRGIFADDVIAIDNAGSIEGTDNDGISAMVYGSSLTNHDGGTISGVGKGANIGGDVTNTGEGSRISSNDLGVRAQGGATLRNEDGAEIEAVNLGVDMYDGGDVYNNTGATILATGATSSGVDVWIYGSVTNSGEGSSITGGNYAVTFNYYDIDSVFELTNTDKATINGGYTGVAFFDTEGTVLNEEGAAITANSYGIKFDNSTGTVTNQTGAAITSLSGSGIQMDSGGEINNKSGSTITGVVTGLILLGGDTYTITNTGAGSSITATGSDVVDEADSIYVEGPATITNSDGASISGTRFGTWLKAGGGVTNEGEGTIISGGRTAILGSETTTVDNLDGALITGVSNGILFSKGGTVTNGAAAEIRGGTAIRNETETLIVTNSGAINGVHAGISTDSAATITNKLGGGISASDTDDGIGVYMSDGGTLRNESGATIFGGLRGVQGWGADITNTGEDSAITSDGTAVQTWAGGGSVTNADGATMHGGENGVLLDISTALENSGGATIIGDSDNGVISYNGGIVTNRGEGSAISGGIAGIFLQGGTGTITNEDGASISGGYGAIALFEGGSVINGAGSTLDGDTYGIYAQGGGTTVSNAGRIIGDVALSTAHDNDVTLYTGSSIDGNLYIDNRATSTLTFDGAGEQLLSDAVTGSFSFGGILTKQGTGTWTIDKNLLATTTYVTDGGLVVGIDGHGNLISDVTVSTGAWLGGSGTIYGNVIVDGLVAPGNSPGVLTIVGDYTQNAGSTFDAQIDTDSGLYDQINATGTVTIAPGAVLNVTRVGSAPYVVGTQYVFVSATSISGSYDVTGDLVISPFLTLTDHYDPGVGYLEVQQTMSLAVAVPATSANQSALVNGIQSAPTSPINAALTNLPSVAAVTAALPQLTGELHPSMAGAMMEDSRYLRNAAIGRLEDAPCAQDRPQQDDAQAGCGTNPTRFWSSGIGAWGHGNSAGEAASLTRSTGGVLFGVDTTYNNFWRAGLLTGYGLSHFEMNDRASSATSDDYHLGFYVGTLPGQAAVKLGALRTWHHISSRRSVNMPGLFNQLDANYHATTTQVFGEAGYRIAATENKVQPFINVTHVSNDVASFSESGSAAALTEQGGGNSAVLSTLGLHLGDVFPLGTARIVAKGTIGLRHASGDTTPGADFEIGGGSAYRINGLPIARNALTAQADIEARLADGVTFGVSGDGEVSNGAMALGLQARLVASF